MQQEKPGFRYKKIPPARDLLQILFSVPAGPVSRITESFVRALKAILSTAKRLHSLASARPPKIAAKNRISAFAVDAWRCVGGVGLKVLPAHDTF
jgi:hypothetical protein